MAKCIAGIILAVLLSLSLPDRPIFAQSKNYDSGSSGSGATIVDISWRGAFSTGYQYVPAGAFSIDVKNTGTQTIIAIGWEFFLVDTVRGDTVYDHFKFFTNDKTIKPGEKKRLTKRFEYHSPPDYVAAKARLMVVEYADGSRWERKPDEK